MTPTEESKKRNRVLVDFSNPTSDPWAGAVEDGSPIPFFAIKSRSSCHLVGAIAMGLNTQWDSDDDVIESVISWLDPHAYWHRDPYA